MWAVSSIEASKIAGHSPVRTTEGYTKIQLNLLTGTESEQIFRTAVQGFCD